jgi:hypothetical protein
MWNARINLYTKTITMKKIYIAGKVTGLDHEKVKEKFNKAENTLLMMGWDVVNPTKLVTDPDTEWKQAMKICLKELLKCDAIFLLNDWESSRGAKVEEYFARKKGIDVFYPQ